MNFYNNSTREHVLIGVLIGVILATVAVVITINVAN